jgi:carboxypeptidase Taq
MLITALGPAIKKADTLGHLHCDWKLHCPTGGRGEISSLKDLAEQEAHDAFVTPEIKGLIKDLMSEKGSLDPIQRLVASRLNLSYGFASALPSDFVKEKSRITSASNDSWREAREKNDFTLWLPHLEKVIKVSRETAGFLGADTGNVDSVYAALLGGYEPGMSMERIKEIMGAVKEWLIPYFARIRGASNQPSDRVLYGFFEPEKQRLLSERVLRAFGFDFKRGTLVMNDTIHPFCAGISPNDCRLSTRYKVDFLSAAFFGTCHENGHGLFHQGVHERVSEVRVSEFLFSLGIHESQSRLWENGVARSMPFWQHFYPSLRTVFPEFERVSLDDFYLAINVSKPTPVRIYADELSYNLHILIRWMLELALLSGELKARDYPVEFNRMMTEDVGFKPVSLKEGALQDTHLSDAYIGYSITYLLGNLGYAQSFYAFKKDVTDWAEHFSRGNFGILLDWFRGKVHSLGMVKTLDELMIEVTGEPLNPQYWFDYIQEKFGRIYKI